MENNQNSSTPKLTQSYVHNASSNPFIYRTIAQSFDELTTQDPDYECYVFKEENKRYTYATLKHEIDCMAMALLELGFEKNDRLYVALPNCSESVVLIHVAAKLGLVKVHGNPYAVESELAAALSKVDCKGIVMASDEDTIAKFQEAVPDFDGKSSQALPSLKHIILTGSSNEKNIPGAHSYNNLIKQSESKKTQQQDALDKHQAAVDPDSPLAIILTSGSTGEPQPVVLTNFAVLNTLMSHLHYFGSAFARPCGTQAMNHISTGIWTILLVAVHKCTVVIPSSKFDAKLAMKEIDQEKCTGLIVSPILFRNILADPDRSKHDFSSLKCVAVGATHVQPKFLRQIEKELRVGRAGQAYGLTESGCVLTASVHCEDDRRYTSIGQCMPHMELKLVDDDGKIVPIGTEGEIWARGFAIMQGYYNDSEKTAETKTDAGWLQTGDLATMDEDGYLYFIERKKFMIVTQAGANVSPSEVEHAIEEHESVDEAHVFSIDDPQVEGVICAYVKLKSGTQCEVDELKNFLGSKLSPQKIPEHIRFVDEFTRTSLGKVSKYKLAEEMLKTIKS